ncbi:hypothetical protein EAE96_003493 [Botrytis aclada]|nr:hypothetical protein EAE96_003493 [Botrytis aclada]
MSSNNIRSGRQPRSGTSANQNKLKSREDKNEPIPKKRTEISRGDKKGVNLPIRNGSASTRSAPPSKTIVSQALVPLSSDSGVVTVGRTRTPPSVIEIYGTLGQVVLNRLYRSMLEYNSRNRNSATLGFVSKQPRTFDLRCDKTITTEVLGEILPQDSKLECFVIQEVKGLGLKDSHYAFQLKENVGDLVYIQGPRYGFAFKPTSASNGYNALVSKTAPLMFRSFRSYVDMDMDKSLEEYRDAMMKAFKEPLSHRDISDIWNNLRERPTDLCGAGKSPITWDEVWKSLENVYGKDCLKETVDAATKAFPPQYCEQYVGLTTVQQMYPDNVSFC